MISRRSQGHQWRTTGLVLLAALLVSLVAGPSAAQPAFQQLLEDLQSPREGTRAKAVRALTTSGYPDVASTLMPLLGDSANEVQLEVIDGLVSLAIAPAPAPNLAVPLKPVRGSITWSLFEAGPLAVLPRTWPPQLTTRLASTLRDEDSRVRLAAAGALAVIASPLMPPFSPDSRNALVIDIVYSLRNPDVSTREAVARAAGAIFTAPAVADVPVAIGDALIAALNDTEPTVRAAASEALGWVRDARGEQALRDRFAFYGTGSDAETALHALARMAGRASTDIFRQALGSRQRSFRVMAVEGLGRLRDRAAVPSVTALIRSEREPSVLLAAAFASYLLGERGNLERLVGGLVQPDLARQARAYLTELGADAAPGLHAWLRQNDPVTRRAVVEVLGLSGHAASEPVLQEVARSDGNPAVAETARQAVLRLRALPQGARTR
jgi:HEAT repeat protein